MSDSDDYEYDDFGGDYYYLEDEYGPADDLAEHACPSPIQHPGDDEWDEHTRFTSYWEDLNYNSDSYFSEKEYAKQDKKQSKKRTAEEVDSLSPAGKRLRFHNKSQPGSPILANVNEVPPPILWVKQSDRPVNSCRGKLVKNLGRPVRIVKNANRLMEKASAFGKARPKAKLEKVKDAVEDDPVDVMAFESEMAVPSQKHSDIDAPTADDAEDADEDGWEDDDEDGASDDGEADNDGDEEPRIDPDMLKMALRQHLAAAGIKFDGMNEATLLRFATKMLSGEANSDDVAGELADDLLGEDEAEEDEDGSAPDKKSGFAQWVSGQVKASTKDSEKETDLGDDTKIENTSTVMNGNGIKRKADRKEADDDQRPSKKRIAESHRVLTVDVDGEEAE